MSEISSNLSKLQLKIIEQIESRREDYIKISHDIHAHPEVGNHEFFASEILIKTLDEAGFRVEKAVAGHATSFIARKKSKKTEGPTIGFLAEYDALPGLGHACGHNIIGTTSIAAAISIADIIDETGGEVVVLGTPAEEGGENGSAKASFVKYNLLKGIDACMMLHPANKTSITGNSLAVDPLDFEFFGKAAHAAACPEKGINALDAVILLFNGINALRQHVSDDVRIHGIITHGGDAPNIIPDYAKARFFIRAATRKGCDEITRKVKNIAEGAALSTGAEFKITAFQNQVDNLLPNKAFDDIFVRSAHLLGMKISTEDVKGIGSTDAGNISQVVPTIHPHIKIGSDELTGHTPEFCVAAVSEDGDKALINGAKSLALTALVLLTDSSTLKDIKEDFDRHKDQ